LRGAGKSALEASSDGTKWYEDNDADMSDREKNHSHRGPNSADNGRESSPPLALLASDQEWSTRSLESVLGPHGFASVRAYTGRQALELIRRTHPDVVIIDSGMPDIPGIDLCLRLRDDPEFPSSTPVVMTTAGPASRSQRLDAYRAGVWEYLSLPVDAEALILKLAAFVRAKREIDRSREESLLDDSTGLYNVRGLARRAREMGAEASRRHSALACVAVTASASGELGADELDPRVAEELGDLCRRTARCSDAVGRLGRSDFAILAPATDDAGAVRLAERLREGAAITMFSSADSVASYDLRAGYCAYQDFSKSPVDAVELLLRAATALRHVRAQDGALISAYQDVPAHSVQ
jgi:PleD family two-component response regulator